MIRKQDVSLGVGWGGVGMMTYLALAHMFDDTQTGCFSRGGVGWGGYDDVPSTCMPEPNTSRSSDNLFTDEKKGTAAENKMNNVRGE